MRTITALTLTLLTCAALFAGAAHAADRIIPMFGSPLLGLIGGFILMAALYLSLRSLFPRTINMVFGKLPLVSSSYLGFSHGCNDAQKTMGIIALALFTATTSGHFEHSPGPGF